MGLGMGAAMMARVLINTTFGKFATRRWNLAQVSKDFYCSPVSGGNFFYFESFLMQTNTMILSLLYRFF